MNVVKVAELVEACWPHCPPHPGPARSGASAAAEDEQEQDATDMLPSLDNEHTRCGRHCYKMQKILERLRNGHAPPSSTAQSAPPITQARSARKHMHATLIVMAEETDAGSRKSPCVLLEGNHRCVGV